MRGSKPVRNSGDTSVASQKKGSTERRRSVDDEVQAALRSSEQTLGALACASHGYGTTCPSGPTASRTTIFALLLARAWSPNASTAPPHPGGLQRLAHRGSGSTVAAGVRTPIRSASVAQPMRTRTPRGRQMCLGRPSRVPRVACLRSKRPPQAQEYPEGAGLRRSCKHTSSRRWKRCHMCQTCAVHRAQHAHAHGSAGTCTHDSKLPNSIGHRNPHRRRAGSLICSMLILTCDALDNEETVPAFLMGLAWRCGKFGAEFLIAAGEIVQKSGPLCRGPSSEGVASSFARNRPDQDCCSCIYAKARGVGRVGMMQAP